MNVTTQILAQAIEDLSLNKAADLVGISKSNAFKYKNGISTPSAETWLKSLIRLGHVKVNDGKLVIKSDVISKELLKEMAV